jgi:hypothetical protein
MTHQINVKTRSIEEGPSPGFPEVQNWFRVFRGSELFQGFSRFRIGSGLDTNRRRNTNTQPL